MTMSLQHYGHQGVGAVEGELHGQQEPGHLLVADLAAGEPCRCHKQHSHNGDITTSLMIIMIIVIKTLHELMFLL